MVDKYLNFKGATKRNDVISTTTFLRIICRLGTSAIREENSENYSQKNLNFKPVLPAEKNSPPFLNQTIILCSRFIIKLNNIFCYK